MGIGGSGFQLALVASTGVLLVASFIGAQFLGDQWLHHVPTVLALPLLWRCAWKGALSDASMTAIVLFMWLHILGARYIYSYVPYDDWSRALCGASITDTFQFTRNHYDRLVHLLFGALAMVPQVEVLQRNLGLGRVRAVLVSFALVLAISVAYEVFEWLLAVVMAPDLADRYNGQQGDSFDSQKDVLCAAIGAFTTALVQISGPRRPAAISPEG